MNRNAAKTIALSEIESFLPKWWLDIFQTTISILNHSTFVSFVKVEQFVKAAIQFQQDKETSEFKHINVKVENKGERNGLIYITIVTYFIFKDQKKNSWRLSKSLHVRKRASSYSNYD